MLSLLVLSDLYSGYLSAKSDEIRNFPSLTGYAKHEVLGRNCRFLSGTGTDPTTQFQVKKHFIISVFYHIHCLNIRILSYVVYHYVL